MKQRSSWFLRGLALLLSLILMGCSGAPRLIALPGGDRGVNSRYAELFPSLGDRSLLVFVSDRRGSQDAYLYNWEQRQQIPLPGLNSLDLLVEHPAISADGNWIAFAGSRGDRTNIYLYDRRSQQLRNLTANLEAIVRNPSLSRDGQRIAFEAALGGQWDVLVYDRDAGPLDLIQP
ncbi:Tol biopolymer transporter periplasmic protein [Synechococcus elongatus IITB3]|uniref:TolB family protein n=2 Tax=Synechococcus elongatus TaxID=32046 RepID=UPI0030CCD315